MANRDNTLILDYDKTSCDRCGAPTRIVAQPCTECGRRPAAEEVNDAVSDRHRIVDEIRAAISGDDLNPHQSLPGISTVTTDQFNDYVENALDPILKSFAEVARQSRTSANIASLRQLARHHFEVATAAESIPLRRPHVERLQYLKRQAADIGAITNLYLEVLASPNIHEAQNLARQAQSHIDAMASRRGVQNTIQAALEEISSADFLDGGGIDLFRALSVRHGGLSVAELEDRGRAEFTQLSGREPQVGMGLTYLMCDLFSAANFDRDRFRQVVRRTAQLSADNSETLDSLAEDVALLSDLHEARLRAVQAWVRFQRTVAGRITTPALIREVVALYSELFEQVGIPVIGALLLLSGQKTMPYAKLRMQNATALADNLSKSPALRGLIVGLDNNLRNATAHGHSYTVTEDSLSIRLKSYQGAITFDDLTDKMMALMESFTAIQLVLDDELSSRGQDGHQVRDLELFGFSISEVVRLLLTALDVTVHSTTEADAIWTIAIGDTARSKFTLAKVICNVLPSTVKTLVLQYDLDAKVHLLTVEAQALADISAPELTHPVKFLRAAGSVQVDGAPLLDPVARRRFISHYLREVLLSEDIEVVAQLRDLRAAAHMQSDPDLDVAIKDTIRWLRGVPPLAGAQNYRQRLTRQLDDWGRKGDFMLP